jgi:hypothetical protein
MKRKSRVSLRRGFFVFIVVVPVEMANPVRPVVQAPLVQAQHYPAGTVVSLFPV